MLPWDRGSCGLRTLMLIRPYLPETDEKQVFELWQSTLGVTWPLSLDGFRAVTVGGRHYLPGDHLVAEADDSLLGFVGTQVSSDSATSKDELMLIMVEPSHQRRGIGRSLLDAALLSLKQRGVTGVQLASAPGTFSYFWPGIPTELDGAWSFFQACGWDELELSFALIRKLEDYETPPFVTQRIREAGVTVQAGSTRDIEDVLAFEQSTFPHWYPYFEILAESPSQIVLARDHTGAVVGTSS